MARQNTPKKKGLPEHLKGKGKKFTSEYQPTPEAKKAGLMRAKAKNIVLNAIIQEVTENITEIKIKGKKQKVSTLEALIKKMLMLSAKDDKALLRVMNMLLEYESRNTAIEQRQEEFSRRVGTEEDQDFNDSFIQALNAQTGDVWDDVEVEELEEPLDK